jgi:hypothetical protein
LPCPFCGEANAPISLALHALGDECFRCEECSTDFSVEQIQALFARWQPVLAWLEHVPQLPEE